MSKLSFFFVRDLSSNQIKAVSRIFGNSSSVKTFKLKNNPLELVPDNMLQESAVSEIDLRENRLPEVPPSAFNGQNFENLTITHNQVVTVPKASLAGLKATLKRLDLSNNLIEIIEDGTFVPLTALTSM